jgi:hypothetical protein
MTQLKDSQAGDLKNCIFGHVAGGLKIFLIEFTWGNYGTKEFIVKVNSRRKREESDGKGIAPSQTCLSQGRCFESWFLPTTNSLSSPPSFPPRTSATGGTLPKMLSVIPATFASQHSIPNNTKTSFIF